MAEPAEKKAKIGEEAKEEEKKDVEMTPKVEQKKAPEPPKELEEDAKKDTGPKIKDDVSFLVPDTTLNVMQSSVGNIFMPLTEGGMGYLQAGVRASVGVKSGRYMFEAKIVELMAPSDDKGPKGGKKNIFRIGFSTAGSSLLIGEGEDSVCFDDDGHFIYKKKKTQAIRAGPRGFSRDTPVAVVLNLEKDHPNFNTVSLFVGGVRACQPQALPESLQGKVLFPTVSFRQTTVHVNCGPSPVNPLPFTCKMISEAAKSDATVTTYKQPAKYDVVFPVGLPDEGVFDWVDMFLEKNPLYTELSARAIIAWAESSGLWTNSPSKDKDSVDAPYANFGVPDLDNFSIKKILHQAATLQGRHLVVVELKSSLLKEERLTLLEKFAGNPGLKTVSRVLIGEPTADFKKKTLAKALQAKQAASDKEFKIKKTEEKRQKVLAQKKKELEKQQKKAAKIQKKKMEEAKKVKEELAKKRAKEIEKKAKELEKAKKKKEAEAKGEQYVEEPEEEEKEEEKKEEPEPEEEEEEEEDAPMEEEKDEEPPTVSLTAEEKSKWFFTGGTPDVSSYALSTNFANFTLPEKSDGFDEIVYEWENSGAKCKTYLEKWIVAKKQVTKVEALQPSAWFHKKYHLWQGIQQTWTTKANEYKSLLSKKAAEKAQKAAKKLAAERKAALDAAKKLAELKKKEEEEAKKEGDKDKEKEEEKPEEKKEEAKEEAKPMEVEEEEEEAPEVEVDFAGVDIFGVEDVCDIGGKMPLFKDFQFEDWSLMSLRYELSLLVHAFRKDVNDPERPGMPLDHVDFYFNKYFKKNLSTKYYGVEDMSQLISLVNDTLFVTKDGLLDTQLCEEMESLSSIVKLTEEARRYRKLLLDMGKDEAKLKITGMDSKAAGGGGGQKRDWQGGQKQGSGWGGQGKGGKGGKGWSKGGKSWGRR
mmetsp:Transcript_103489/g.194714  ORF Transcript_103489/g.194714 Transcript_103489/m.194714 type:complete len:922 (-) Transcript_103489:155-2920(-)